MDEKKGFNALPMKYKIALLALCPALIIALCSGVIILYAGSLVEEGTYTPPVAEAVWLHVIPETDAEKLQSVNTLLDNAQNSGETQITCSTRVDFYNLTSELNDAQNALLQFASGDIENGIAGFMKTDGIAYGEKKTVLAAFENAEIEIPETEDGSLVYSITAENAFADADEALFAAAEQEFSSTLTIESRSIAPVENNVSLHVDYTTDRLQKIVCTRSYHLAYTVTFTGDLASLGTKALEFDCTLTNDYTVTWAGISIAQERISLNKTGYQALNMTVNKTADAPAEDYKLTFVSSDESVAVVTDQGVVEAVALSDKPVTVTATLEYLGKTYIDSCEVLVIIEPESVKMHSKAQTLQIGEQTTLSASVQPEKASIKNIIWFSPDESVATVDENGVVTAVGEGKVQIIAVSEIGEFMAGCNITVEGGAK